MEIRHEITVDAPASKVWDVLGPNYAHCDAWASSVKQSSARAEGRPLPGAPTSGRICETHLGPFRETLLDYDDGNHTLAYEATGSKMPFFVKRLTNRWSLSAAGSASTRVVMVMQLHLMPGFSLVMGPMMRRQMGGVGRDAIEEFKHYVETGRPHPRKQAALAKAA